MDKQESENDKNVFIHRKEKDVPKMKYCLKLKNIINQMEESLTQHVWLNV